MNPETLYPQDITLDVNSSYSGLKFTLDTQLISFRFDYIDNAFYLYVDNQLVHQFSISDNLAILDSIHLQDSFSTDYHKFIYLKYTILGVLRRFNLLSLNMLTDSLFGKDELFLSEAFITVATEIIQPVQTLSREFIFAQEATEKKILSKLELPSSLSYLILNETESPTVSLDTVNIGNARVHGIVTANGIILKYKLNNTHYQKCYSLYNLSPDFTHPLHAQYSDTFNTKIYNILYQNLVRLALDIVYREVSCKDENFLNTTIGLLGDIDAMIYVPTIFESSF